MGVQRRDALVGGASGAAAAAPQPIKQLSAGASRAGAGEHARRGMTTCTACLVHVADSNVCPYLAHVGTL